MLAYQESLIVLISRNPLTFNMILQAKVATAFSSAALVGTNRPKTLCHSSRPIHSIDSVCRIVETD